MTGEKAQTDRDIFKQALQLPPEVRGRYLDEACGQDTDLRQDVESLLEAYEAASGFMERPALAQPGEAGDRTFGYEPLAEQAGTIIGPYKLLQQIGEGGMGVVFMAEQTEPIQRTVALKIIKAGMDTRQVIARFEAERQALAMMDHPNIARVIDAGTTEAGRSYFVMDLVKGVPITDYCDQQHLTVRQRLELFTQVCHAVQHAHQKGIIHRDLKPSNVLVAEYDGKPVPKVIDFGVAKATAQRLTERTMFTEYGQLIGTFEYMSPEQARFNQLDVDTRSDIYSLGVVLYELLTGSTPLEKQRLRSAAFDEILRFISEEDPPNPSTRLSSSRGLPSIAANRGLEPKKLTGSVKGELDWIVMKCLEKNRNQRYETANGLASDIERYLTDEPVEARPATRTYRLKKFVRRNTVLVLAGAAVVAALATGLALAAVGFIQARHQARIAVAEATRAATAQRQAEAALNDKENALRERESALQDVQAKELLQRRRYYASQMNLAQRALAANEPTRVLDLLGQNRPKPGEADMRGFEWYYLRNQIHRGLRRSIFWPAGREHRGLAVSRDGKTLAVSGGSGTLNGVVKLIAVDTGQLKQTLPIKSWGSSVLAFSPDGSKLASGSSHLGVVVLWKVADATEITRISSNSGPVRSLRFSPDGQYLAVGYENGAVIIRDATTLETVARLKKHDGASTSVVYSPDGTQLYSAAVSDSGVAISRVYDCTKISPELVNEIIDFRLTDVSPDGRILVGGWQRKVTLWDVTANKSAGQFAAHPESISVVRFTSDGRSLVSAGNEDRTAILWDISTRQAMMRAPHPAAVTAVDCAVDGTTWFSLSDDGTVNIWASTAAPTTSVVRLKKPILHALLLPDATELILSGEFPAKRLDMASGESRAHGLSAEHVCSVSADGQRLASSEWQPAVHKQVVTIWDSSSGAVRHTIPVPNNKSPLNVCLSPNGQQLAICAVEGPIFVWQLSSESTHVPAPWAIQYRHPVWWNELPCKHLAFSPDNHWLAAAYEMGKVNIYNVKTHQTVPLQLPETPWATKVAFSPDGRLLAAGNDIGVVSVFDTVSGEIIASLSGHEAGISAIAFLPDRATVAIASQDTIRLWDLLSQQERFTLDLTPDSTAAEEVTVDDLAITPDGRTLISRQSDGSVQVWRGIEEAVELSLAADPNDPPPLPTVIDDGRYFAERAIVHAGLSHWDRALSDCREAERLKFEWARGKFHLAMLFDALSTKEDFANPQDAVAAQGIQDYVLSVIARAKDPIAMNDAAWSLASQNRPSVDAVELAVNLAKKAIELDPDYQNNYGTAATVGMHINTALGVAYYRAGKWQEAIDALRRARERNGQYAVGVDGFFLAMAYAKQGERETALRWFRACDRWMAVFLPHHQEQLMFRAEAAAVLGLNLESLEPVLDSTEERRGVYTLLIEADPEAQWPRVELAKLTEDPAATSSKK